MKLLITIAVSCFVVISCEIGKNEDPSDDARSSVFYDERARQIENARHNREMVPGKWRIIKLKDTKDEDFQLVGNRYKALTFDTYEFLPISKYVFYKGKESVQKGTVEWMAEDREIVFTPDDESQVDRLLIKSMNDRYMNASSRAIYMILKKEVPDTTNLKDKRSIK